MADRLTIEHYVGEAFVKCGQVILGSRILPSGSAQQARPARDKRAGRWFLLELDELDGVGREVERWRKDISTPLVVEILMAQGGAAAVSSGGRLAADGEAGVTLPGEALTLLERWTLQCERCPPPGSSSSMAGAGGGGGGSSSGNGSGTRTYLDEVSVYKRLTILVRSLYSYTRVLPAYKLFRVAKRCQGGEQFQMYYRISRSLQPQAVAGSAAQPSPPPPRLHDFMFAPVDTPGGRFRVAVQYNPSAAALVLEQSTVPVAMPYTINENYLGPGGAVAGSLPGSSGYTGHGAPGTSAPAAGGMARHLRPAMSASVYGSTASGRSPPVGADTGILRHSPSMGAAGGGGGGGGMMTAAQAGGGAGQAAPPAPRVIVRQSWSSKEMKVSFSLPPPPGSPGGLGLAGMVAGVFRRSSSGYGSTPSTPPLPSPVYSGRPQAPQPGSSGGSAAAAAVSGSYSHQRPPSYHQQQQQPPYNRCGSGNSSNLGTTPPTAAASPSGLPPSRPPGATAGGKAATAGAATAGSGAAAAAASVAPGPGSASPGSASAFATAAWQRQHAAAVNSGAGAGAAAGGSADQPGPGGPAGADGAAAVAEPGTGEEASGPGQEAGAGSASADRTFSAPVAIPSRSSSRTRSVNDLRTPAVYGGFEVHPAVAAAAASSRTAATAAAAAAAGLLAAQDDAADAEAADGAAAAGVPHHRMAPGSAPAAPRGMLGLALGALKPGAAASSTHSDAAYPTTEADGGAGKDGRRAASRSGSASQFADSDAAAAAAAAAARRSGAPEDEGSETGAGAACRGGGGGGPSGQASQALAVVHSSYQRQQQHHYQHHRQLSAHYGLVPGSSPPAHGGGGGGRPLPVPVGSLPPYGSPQLPFAFTPSVQSMSLASLHRAMVPLGYFGGHGGGAPSGGAPRAVSGRDITCLATIRRPSWSSRSGSLDPSLASAGAAGHLLPSPSPLHDMESSFSNASTPGATNARPDSHGRPRRPGQPRNSSSSASAIFSLSPNSALPSSPPPPPHHQRHSGGKAAEGTGGVATSRGAGAGGSGVADASTGHGSGGGGTPAAANAAAADGAPGAAADPSGHHIEAANAISYDLYGQYGGVDGDMGLCPLAREDSESDLLPFALDQEGLLLSPGGGPGGAHMGAAAAMLRGDPAGRPGHPAAGPIERTLNRAHAEGRDVAVGAFVRMMTDAAPLAAPPGHPATRDLSGRQALAELEQLGLQIRSALVGPQLHRG